MAGDRANQTGQTAPAKQLYLQGDNMPDKTGKVDLVYALNLKPEKAIEYLKNKGYATTWDWHDLWQESHAKAFTVAKAMRLDILQDIRGAVQKALDEGITFEQFRKELEPRLKAKGWWGRVMVGDETGAQEIQLGSPWRLQTIYRTNTQTAYMTGRYRSFVENIDNRPFWQYVAVLDSRTRPAHRALDGQVFRYDDPFWETHYPPNGWGCRCRVRALSEIDVRDRNLQVEDSTDKLIESNALVSKKTGEIVPVTSYKTHDSITGKAITVTPDPGWNYNPGKAAWQPNLDKYDYQIAKQYVQDNLDGPAFKQFYSGKSAEDFPVAVLDKPYRELIGSKNQTVWLSKQTLWKNKKHAQEGLEINDYLKLPDIIENADLVVQDGDQTMVFIKLDDKLYHAAIKSTQTGLRLFLTSFRLTSTADMQRIRKKGKVLRDRTK